MHGDGKGERRGGGEGGMEGGEEGGRGGGREGRREGGGEEDIQCVVCVPTTQSHLVSLRHMTHNYL